MSNDQDELLKLKNQSNDLEVLIKDDRKKYLKKVLSKVSLEDKEYICQNLGKSFNSISFKTVGKYIRDKYELTDLEAIEYINKINDKYKKTLK